MPMDENNCYLIKENKEEISNEQLSKGTDY